MAWKSGSALRSYAAGERQIRRPRRLPIAHGRRQGTNPEELISAAHAGRFSTVLALQLTNAGFTVKRIHTTAKVYFESMTAGWSIHRINLETEASVSDVATAAFEEYAQSAKRNCPVSRALSGVDIHLQAKLL